ncbi:cytochrome bd-I oxidase subunit CydX [Thauera humireducens]|uniref:cytochrome bd-I oxidase subunit CydX n=1 Tax=Thauera TaxID=33057 RepID=UPI0002CE7DA9|nr:Cyd operon protein YbgT [Thauera sp. 63]
MWYFAWVLGIGFAVLLAILNALWGENEEARAEALRQTRLDAAPADPNGSGAH